MNATVEPKLAPPGAGLPFPELLIARLLFALRRRRGDRDSFNDHFRREREAIRAMVSSCNPESGARRVLIPRIRGLEDSSRNWSVWMTLDHLRIVNHGMIRIIESLAKGVVPSGKSSTAAVKPSPDAAADVFPKYENTCDHLLATVSVVPDLKTSVRYSHPWFGPLDAAGWHALAGGHMGIHRRQIELILHHQTDRPSA